MEAAAGEQDRARRSGMVGVARRELDRLEAIIRNNPRLALINFGGEAEFRQLMEQERNRL